MVLELLDYSVLVPDLLLHLLDHGGLSGELLSDKQQFFLVLILHSLEVILKELNLLLHLLLSDALLVHELFLPV